MLVSHWCCCGFYLSPQKVFSVGDPSSVPWAPTCRALPGCEQPLQTCPHHTAGAVDHHFPGALLLAQHWWMSNKAGMTLLQEGFWSATLSLHGIFCTACRDIYQVSQPQPATWTVGWHWHWLSRFADSCSTETCTGAAELTLRGHFLTNATKTLRWSLWRATITFVNLCKIWRKNWDAGVSRHL